MEEKLEEEKIVKNNKRKWMLIILVIFVAIGVLFLFHDFRKVVCRTTSGGICINVFMGIHHLPDEGDRKRIENEKQESMGSE